MKFTFHSGKIPGVLDFKTFVKPVKFTFHSGKIPGDKGHPMHPNLLIYIPFW